MAERWASVKVPREMYEEMRALVSNFLLFPASAPEVLQMWPCSPCCNALLLQLTKSGELVCWKYGKRYKLSPTSALQG